MSIPFKDHAVGKVLKRKHSSITGELIFKKRLVILPGNQLTMSDFNTRLKRSHTSRLRHGSSTESVSRHSSISPVVRERHSTLARRSGSLDAYSRLNPWVADFLNDSLEGPSSPRAPGEASHTCDSNGPSLLSHQLLGDSLFVRFADQILHERPAISENGKFSNGHCISGQTIQSLLRRVERASCLLQPKVIVLIGTNDFLKGCAVAEVRQWMLRLLAVLKRKKVRRVVVLTLPPIPRLASQPNHWERWEEHNRWIKSLEDGSTVRVVDAAPLFLVGAREPDMVAYERYMGHGSRRRIDHIHLNNEGLTRLNREMCKQIEALEK